MLESFLVALYMIYYTIYQGALYYKLKFIHFSKLHCKQYIIHHTKWTEIFALLISPWALVLLNICLGLKEKRKVNFLAIVLLDQMCYLSFGHCSARTPLILSSLFKLLPKQKNPFHGLCVYV